MSYFLSHDKGASCHVTIFSLQPNYNANKRSIYSVSLSSTHSAWSIQQYPHVWSLDYQRSLWGNFCYFYNWISFTLDINNTGEINTFVYIAIYEPRLRLWTFRDIDWWTCGIVYIVFVKGAIFCHIHLSAGKLKLLLYFNITLTHTHTHTPGKEN